MIKYEIKYGKLGSDKCDRKPGPDRIKCCNSEKCFCDGGESLIRCETPRKSYFLKNGKMVISVKI